MSTSGDSKAGSAGDSKATPAGETKAGSAAGDSKDSRPPIDANKAQDLLFRASRNGSIRLAQRVLSEHKAVVDLNALDVQDFSENTPIINAILYVTVCRAFDTHF